MYTRRGTRKFIQDILSSWMKKRIEVRDLNLRICWGSDREISFVLPFIFYRWMRWDRNQETQVEVTSLKSWSAFLVISCCLCIPFTSYLLFLQSWVTLSIPLARTSWYLWRDSSISKYFEFFFSSSFFDLLFLFSQLWFETRISYLLILDVLSMLSRIQESSRG